MKNLILCILVCLPFITKAQDCDCISKYKWVKKTFEENDAGFAYSVEKKTELAYQLHNQKFEEEFQKITDPSTCYQTLQQWLKFFRSGHIGISPLNQANGSDEALNEDEIREKFKDWEKVDIDFKEFNNDLKSKKEADYEGIWVSGNYEIGVKKIGDAYLGFIINADGVYWTEKQLKFKINADHSATYYMQDHSPRDFEHAEILSNNYLEMGFINLARKAPKFDDPLNLAQYFRLMEAEEPIFESINEQTVLIRIPSFSGSEKEKIDQLIAQHKEQILRTPNLILDLRNNGGGSDRSYYELLPFLYTDTIRVVGLDFLSTPLNNQRMLDFAENTEYGFSEEDKAEFRAYYKTLSKNLGEFVSLDTVEIDHIGYDTIYPYPENVGIIINEGNASTTEQFLLAAKQSLKVKLFGTKTYGALDVSNMNFVRSPCNDFGLSYCLSKSYRIPDMAIDDVGIQPDFYINKQIPKHEWIKFVTKILNP